MSESNKGVIYVMTTVVSGLVKIGKTGTDTFEKRMYNLERNGYCEESLLETCTKLRNTEVLRKHEMANRFAFVEGMRVYRKSNGAFGNVVRVYKNQGVKYVDIDFGGKVVSFNYEKTVAADGFMAVKNK